MQAGSIKIDMSFDNININNNIEKVINVLKDVHTSPCYFNNGRTSKL